MISYWRKDLKNELMRKILMRLRKAFLIMTMFVCFSGTLTYAQIGSNDYVQCSEVSESTIDFITIVNVQGIPGDTVFVPVSISNFENMSAFNILIKWDTTYLKPLIDTVDPSFPEDTFYSFRMAPRFQDVQDKVNAKSSSEISIFTVRNSFVSIDDGAVVATFFYIPECSFEVIDGEIVQVCDGIEPIVAGNGVVFRLGFIIDSTMPDGQSASLTFQEGNECILISPDEFFCANCRRSEYSASRFSGFDTNNDSTFSEVPIFPTMQAGTVTSNNAPPPTIEEFLPSADTVAVNASFALSWVITNADSLKITGPNTSKNSILLTGFVFVTAPASTGTYSYVLTAYNEFDSAKVTSKIVVTSDGGGGGGNNNPFITVGSNFTVEQGQSLSFNVTATDSDGDVITLSVNQPLPSNATFNSQIGTGTVSSTFSWTPDVSQEGVFTITFTADDGQGGSTQASVSISVTAILQDRLFTTSSPGQKPVGGLPGKKEIFLPIDLVSSQTVYGIEFDISWDYQYFHMDSIVVTDRTPEFVVYDNLGQTPGTAKIVSFGLSNEPVITGNSTAVLYAVFSVDSTAPIGDYPVYIENGRESISPNPEFPSLEMATDSGTIEVDRLGDVNLDKRIDVADLVSLVAQIIGNYSFSVRQHDAGDVIVNGTINVFDLVAVVNLIYGIPLSPVQGQPVFNEMATIQLSYSNLLAGESDDIKVNSELPTDIAGVEIEILYDPSAVYLGKPVLGIDADQLSLTYKDDNQGKLIVLMNFTNPFRKDVLIAAGNAELLSIPVNAITQINADNSAKIKISRALLSTSNSVSVIVDGLSNPLPESFTLKQNYPNPFNPLTTIEFFIGMFSDGAVAKHVNLDIYNVLGQHVTSLVDIDMRPGSYRVEWDATTDKGSKVATGIYLYRLMINSEMKSKKMLLLK